MSPQQISEIEKRRMDWLVTSKAGTQLAMDLIDEDIPALISAIKTARVDAFKEAMRDVERKSFERINEADGLFNEGKKKESDRISGCAHGLLEATNILRAKLEAEK